MPTRQAALRGITQHILRDDGPAFLGVKRALVARIGREWKVGDRLPPIGELARSMAVGQNNAHRAIRELVMEGVLFSRRGMGVFVRELPKAAAERPSVADAPLRGKVIGMVVLNATLPPFVQRMMDGFRQVIGEAGAETRVVLAEERNPVLPQVPGLFASVLFNPSSVIAAPAGKQNLTIVSTADHINPELLTRFDTVGVDQYQGGALAGRVLRDAGCDTACFIGHRIALKMHRFDLTSSSRLHGFETTWGEHLESSNLLYAPGYSIHSGGVRFADYLQLSPRPRGVFAACDELAVGFITAAMSHGLKPGRDYHIVGFDGYEELLPEMALTTVRVPALEMGRRAADLMIRRAAEPHRPVQRVLMTCSLSRGDTVRR